MKQFIASDAKDKVLTEWKSLKMAPYESIQRYVDKFWKLYLKATAYKKIDFAEQKQQFCADLTEEISEYVNSQRPQTISAVIHHTMFASRIHFQPGSKKGSKIMEAKEQKEQKGKNDTPQNSSKPNNNNKAKAKEKEEGHCKRAPLSYAWGKVREHDALILFDPGSTYNFISIELATKLGIHDFEMENVVQAEAAFKGQEALVTPLIGKLRLHVQSYVDKEDFFISPLQHEDVILGAPWFDRMAVNMKFPKRKLTFSYRGKDITLDVSHKGNTIPLVQTPTLDKVMKSSISCYVIFVKESKENACNEIKSETKEEQELSNFLREFQDVFTDDIPGNLPPNRGQDDHTIELLPGSSPPNKPPYQVSPAPQEEIMRQVNELLEKGMVRPSSSPFYSPVQMMVMSPMYVNSLVTRLQKAMGNPALQAEVAQQLCAYGIPPPLPQERGLTESLHEVPIRRLSPIREEGPKEREKRESPNESNDIAPQRRRARQSPTPPKRKRSSPSPSSHHHKKKGGKDSRRKKARKRSPSSPSSSSSSSSNGSIGYSPKEHKRRGHRKSYAAWKKFHKLKKFKKGGKSISFLTYDGTFGATDKVLGFIQQFDAAFGDEGFTESSKLRHVAMHFQKSARQWWASLRGNGEAPKTWKALRTSIMKQLLPSDDKDKVLTEWRSLKLLPNETIHKYVDKFWDLHLKAIVFQKVEFVEQKQQFCAGLHEEMAKYVNSQWPRSITEVIHYTMVASRINFQQGARRNFKPIEAKEKNDSKGKSNATQSSSKGNQNNNKKNKEKGAFKGKNWLSPEEMEAYRKDNKCFKCGEQGHGYRTCPRRNECNDPPRVSMVQAPKEDGHCKEAPLSYAWGKVREHDALILFDPGSTHNFISHELAAKLEIHDFEIGEPLPIDAAFKGHEVLVTPLKGKLRLHVQSYVDKNDFFIFPLKHEDVILGAPWFHCLGVQMKFLERKVSFTFRGLYPILQEKVKGKFLNSYDEAVLYAKDKDRKLKFQAQLRGEIQAPTMQLSRPNLGVVQADPESSQPLVGPPAPLAPPVQILRLPAPPPPHAPAEIPPLSPGGGEQSVSTITLESKGKEKVSDADAMPIKRVRVQKDNEVEMTRPEGEGSSQTPTVGKKEKEQD
ncbi:hypothetical protein L7F22_067398 [Adiantum nelumboides]|nr:hypothetical protein [Adiantum nelumboides]